MLWQIDAVIRRDYSIDPDTLTDDQLVSRYAEWRFVEEIKYKNQKDAVLMAILEGANKILGNGNSDNTVDS